MGYMVVFMLLAFFFGGIGLLNWGMGMCAERFQARGRWQSLPGTIVRVERVYRRPSSPSPARSRHGANYHNFPWIRFYDPRGKEIVFRSELGDMGHTSRYWAGQSINVLYDPDGKIKPLIDSGWSIWFAPISMTFAALLFIVCAVGCSFLYKDRILETTFLGTLVKMFESL